MQKLKKNLAHVSTIWNRDTCLEELESSISMLRPLEMLMETSLDSVKFGKDAMVRLIKVCSVGVSFVLPRFRILFNIREKGTFYCFTRLLYRR